jgi:prophage maintenance system killer protein
VLGNLYQTFDGEAIYKSVQQKAAHPLYFTVKDHCFIDGNKRIAASLFVWYLDQNGILYDDEGGLLIRKGTLAAITLAIALSLPEENKLLCGLVKDMLCRQL